MYGKKIIAGVLLMFALNGILFGCAKDDKEQVNSSETSNSEIKSSEDLESGTAENSTGNRQDGNKRSIMDEFNGRLADVVEFLSGNIPLVSSEDASKMVVKLEEIQKKDMSEVESGFFSDDTVQKEINDVYGPGFDINQLENIKDEELKKKLTEIRDMGFKIESAEGTYFLIINYGFYGRYSAYVTPDIKDYIAIMTVESDRVPAKDAGLVIGWEDVLSRALNQEKFIDAYPDSMELNSVKQLFNNYVSFAFFGTDNTPLFGYNGKEMVAEAKSAYSSVAGSDEDSKFSKAIRNYLDVIEKNNNKLNDEVDLYRKNAADSLTWKME